MKDNNGLSRARLRHVLRDYKRPGPVPASFTVPPGTTAGNLLVIQGTNIQADTQVVIVSDAAGPTETATITSQTAFPSQKNTLGGLRAIVDFANLPLGTVDLFRVFLTGNLGQRVYVGSIGSDIA